MTRATSAEPLGWAPPTAPSERFKETEIGRVPMGWDVVPLGAVATIERGKFAYRPRNDPRFYGGAVPFIQTGDVTKSGGRIRSHSQTLNEKGSVLDARR
jgi:type I restriction enzyme S subunit